MSSFVYCRCAVNGGKPRPKLSWHQINNDGRSRKLGDEFVKNVQYEGNVTNLEMVKNLSRDADFNSRYECRVEHETLTDTEADMLSAHVKLDSNGK